MRIMLSIVEWTIFYLLICTLTGSECTRIVSFFQSAGIELAQFDKIALDSTGQFIYALSVRNPDEGDSSVLLYKSANYGGGWISISPIDEMNFFDFSTFLFVSGGNSGCVVVLYASSTIYVSTDCAGSFVTSGYGISGGALDGDQSGQYLVMVGTITFTDGKPQVFLSSTYGLTWTAQSIGAPDYSPDQPPMLSAVACDISRTRAAIAGCTGYFQNSVVVFTNTNLFSATASNWTVSRLWLDGECATYSSPRAQILIDMDSAGQSIFIFALQTAYRSNDFGATWTNISSAITNSSVVWNSLSCDAACKFIVAAGNNTFLNKPVVYMSHDGGTKWLLVDLPQSAARVTSYTTAISSATQLAVVGAEPGGVLLSSDPYFVKNATVEGELVAGASSLSLKYEFDKLQYFPEATLFLTGVLLTTVKSPPFAVVVRAAGSDNDNDLMTLYEGACTSQDPADQETIQGSSFCFANVVLPKSLINSSGTLVVSTTIYPAVKASMDTICSIEYILSVQPVIVSPVAKEENETAWFVQSVSISVAVVCLVVGLVAATVFRFNSRSLYAYSGVNTAEDHDKSSSVSMKQMFLQATTRNFGKSVAILRVCTAGFLVVAEIWLIYIFRHHSILFSSVSSDCKSIEYLQWWCFTAFYARIIPMIAGVFMIVEIFGPHGIGDKSYAPLLSVDALTESWLGKGTLTMYCLFVMMEPTLVVYLPWNVDVDWESFGGYADAKMEDLCMLLKGTVVTLSVLSQVALVALVLDESDKNCSVFDNRIGVEVFFVVYLAAYAVFNYPTCVQLFSYLYRSHVSGNDDFSELWSPMFSVPKLPTTVHWRQAANVSVLLTAIKTLIMLGVAWEIASWHAVSNNTIWENYAVIIFCVYAVCLMVEVYTSLTYDQSSVEPETDSCPSDVHVDMILIARTYSLDAAKVTRLLRPSIVFYSVAETTSIILLYFIITHIQRLLYIAESYPKAELATARACVSVFVLELASPYLLWIKYACTQQQAARERESLLLKFAEAAVRLDILCLTLFLKLMLSWVFPLCFLLNISLWKEKHQKLSPKEINNLVSFQLRDNWKEVDGELQLAYAANPTLVGYLMVFADRLLKRFTVIYSFAKLVGTIAFTLIINTSYLSCGDPGSYHLEATCPVTYDWIPDQSSAYKNLFHNYQCQSSCQGESTYPTRINYPSTIDPYTPPLPPTPWECTVEISGECICSNWLTFQFTIIVFHVIHYLIQCYYYVRYSYFDPQQNQINCVETYTFAGENLTLFLTQPSMCLLSALEAICIVIVWLEVVINPGASCVSDKVMNMYHIQFALFITFAEVYKANMSTCGKLWKQHDYWWAVWSLVRIDLFLFYGFTLFLQTFFFPFSMFGWCFSMASRKPRSRSSSIEAADKLDARSGVNRDEGEAIIS